MSLPHRTARRRRSRRPSRQPRRPRSPQRFTTTSRVALIGNDWKTLNADVAALEDRGHVLFFEPTALEVHCQAAGWFWDQEIFDFVAARLHLIDRHSLRTYRQAWELKQSGLRMIDDVPRPGAHHMQIAFIHPKSTFGVLTELCELASDHPGKVG